MSKKAALVCSVCKEGKDGSAFTKSQLGKGNDRKCKECTEAPPAKREEPKKGKVRGSGGGESLQCSSCNLSKGKKDFSANQLAKNEDRRCKTCVDAGVAKKEELLECSSCGDELPIAEFSRNQLNKGEERKCKECVDAFNGGGGVRGGGGSGMFGEDFADVELGTLRPELQKLVGKLVHMPPDEAMEMLDQMIEDEELSEDAFQQVMMVLSDLGGEGEDEDEGEDGEGVEGEEEDVIESLGLEVNVAVLHEFEKEKELLARLAGGLKRSERIALIHKVLNLKRDRLVALEKRKYERVFQAVQEDNASDSDEAERTARVQKGSVSRAEALVAGPIDAAALVKAQSVVAQEEGPPRAADLLRAGSKRQDDFCHLILWARGRRFDGTLKEDPAVVRAAAAGDVEGVRALLAAGCNVDSCASWSHKDMMYDRETALVAAARLGNKQLVELLLRCGADPSHTWFDEKAFLASQKDEVKSEPKAKAKASDNPYSFEPPSFTVVKVEPDEETAATAAKRSGHGELADLLRERQAAILEKK